MLTKLAWVAAVGLLSVAVLPLDFQPLRFEPHEPHRAGLLVVLVLLAAPALYRQRLPRSPLLIAVLIWILALLLSTAFSLSISRAVYGDLIRRMGLLSQLALTAGALFGPYLDPQRIGRWLWLAGVLVAAYVCLQVVGLIPGLDDRPPGPMGVATYTGGWLALALLWVGIGMHWQDHPIRKLAYCAGLLLMLVGLVLTESRGAALALAAGVVSAGLLWAAVRGERRVALAIVALVLLAGGALVVLSRADWRDTPLSQLPLVGRLNPDEPDLPRQSREAVWSNTLVLVRHWPVLTRIGGDEDRWHLLRPMFGYGLETFELLHRPLMNSEQPVDRAHNDWLETVITMGWGGVLARLGLWSCAGWVGMKRLAIDPKIIAIGCVVGATVGGLLFWDTPYLPIAVTAGALMGCWLGLLGRAVFRETPVTKSAIDRNAWVALTVLTAYLVDLQFSFVTLATGWPAWLAVGLLLVSPAQIDDNRDTRLLWFWPGIVGALLLRSLILNAASWLPGVALLVVMLTGVWTIAPIPPRNGLWILAFWVVGVLAAFPQPPELAATWDVVLIVLPILLLVPSALAQATRTLRPPILVWGAIVALALFWWGRDIAADIYLSRAIKLSGVLAAESIQPVLALRPLDDRLLSAAGNLALRVAVNPTDTSAGEWLTSARNNLERATWLNGYDANYAYLLALVEEQTALVELDRNGHLERADAYFAAATRLWPNQGYFWREWARFSWDLRGDTVSAYRQVRKALQLDPADEAAQGLLVEIRKASRIP